VWEEGSYTKSSLIESPFTCECGKDNTARIREELIFQEVPDEDEDLLHP
jgi:hypothetical protein